MLDILRDFVAETSTPELLSAIEKAHETFEKLGVPAYNDGFEEILMMHDEVDSGTTMDSICQLTTTLQHHCLAAFSLTVNEDAPISFMDTILRGMLLIPEYDNHQVMLSTAKLDGDRAEVMADILALVTHLTPEEILVYLETANQYTIVKIIELMDDSSSLELSSDEAVALLAERKKYIDKLGDLFAALGKEDLIVVKFIADGTSVGYPFEIYADMIVHVEDLETVPPEKAAHELFAAAVVSCDGFGNPSQVIQNNLEKYVTDANIITKIMSAVRDVHLTVER